MDGWMNGQIQTDGGGRMNEWIDGYINIDRLMWLD